MSRLTKGTIIGIVGVLFWSFAAIFISQLTGHYGMPPLLLAFWRDFLVSLGLLALLLVSRRRLPRVERRQLPFCIAYGLILAVFNAIWTISVPLNGAAVSTVLVYGSLGFIVLLARWLFQERITFAKIIGIIFSLSGCVLVANALDINAWVTRPFGIVVGILSGFMFAVYSLAGKEAVRRGIDTWTAMFFSFSFACLFLLLINFTPVVPGAAVSTGSLLPSLPSLGWLLLVTLALVPTLLGYGLYNLSMNYLPVSIANLLATLEPALTTLEAYLLLGEVMTLVQIVGSLLIVIAIVIVRISENTNLRDGSALLADTADLP